MQVNVLEQTFTVENDRMKISEVFSLINEKINGADLILSHLVIDGNEVYNDFDIYLSDNIEAIGVIDVKVVTINEYINSCLEGGANYLYRAIPEVRLIVEELYQGGNDLQKVIQLVEGIQWIFELITNIDLTLRHPENWNTFLVFKGELVETLKELVEGMENGDSILLADIIQYEILPKLERLKMEMENSSV